MLGNHPRGCTCVTCENRRTGQQQKLAQRPQAEWQERAVKQRPLLDRGFLALFERKGTIDRGEFWLGYLIFLVVHSFMLVLYTSLLPEVAATVILPMQLILAICNLVALCSKRARDQGNSGWVGFFFWVPFLMLYLGVFKK